MSRVEDSSEGGSYSVLEEDKEGAGQTEVLTTKEVKAKEAPPDRSIVRLVFVPSGSPPFGLTSTDKASILEWCQRVRQRGEEYGSYYTVSALCYYARQLELEDIDKVVRIIRQHISDKFVSNDIESLKEYQTSINVEQDNLVFGE